MTLRKHNTPNYINWYQSPCRHFRIPSGSNLIRVFRKLMVHCLQLFSFFSFQIKISFSEFIEIVIPSFVLEKESHVFLERYACM